MAADTKTNDVVLEINNISVSFDGFYALTEVRTKVMRNSIHFFIGPNGAGKTTLLDIICAKTKPTSGTVIFHPKGREAVRLTGMKEYKIVQEGVVRKFQVPSVFVNLTVEENMILSLKGHKGILDSIFKKPSKEDMENIRSTLERVGLEDKASERAGSLAHGQKQWLEIAMQLVQKPEIIMLDEPAAGMNPNETVELMNTIRFVRDNFDMTVLLIEHDMTLVSGICEKLSVLNFGQLLCQGNTSDVLNNPEVITAYLGE